MQKSPVLWKIHFHHKTNTPHLGPLSNKFVFSQLVNYRITLLCRKTNCTRHVALEDLTFLQPLKKSPVFYGNQRCFNVVANARQFSLTWARWSPSKPHVLCLYHLRHRFQTGPFTWKVSKFCTHFHFINIVTCHWLQYYEPAFCTYANFCLLLAQAPPVSFVFLHSKNVRTK